MDSSKGLNSFGRIALIVDLSPSGWSRLKQAQESDVSSKVQSDDSLSILKVLELIFMFAHQYHMLNRSNRISFITLASACTLTYPTEPSETMASKSGPENTISRPFSFETMKTSVLDYLKQIVASTDINGDVYPVPLAVALSRAFLLLNRQEHDLCIGTEVDSELELPLLMGSSNYPARVVVFSLSEDDPLQTIPCMNAIFACNKKGIAIDSIQLGNHVSSPRLQVAADLTGGFHTHVQSQSELLRLIMTVLLVDSPHRNELKMPRLATVDHRATCFCHQRFISLGYVCSVCLAVFCEPSETCKVCSVGFSKDSMPSLLAQAFNQLPSTI